LVEIEFLAKIEDFKRIKFKCPSQVMNPLELNRLKQQPASENYLVRQIRLNFGTKAPKSNQVDVGFLVGKECYWSCEFQLHGREKNTKRPTSG
jgi:hypothetical protein